MTVSKVVVIECDRRGPWAGNAFHLVRCTTTWSGEVSEPRDVVLAAAQRAGWQREGGYDYCPAHAGRKA